MYTGMSCFSGVKLWMKRGGLTTMAPLRASCTPVFLLSVVINIAIMIVAVVNPVHDIWYYVATALALASEVIVVLGIIRDYNYSCTRPLPQFNAYKGGQEEIEIS